MKNKIKRTVTALITMAAMAVPVFVNAGGGGKQTEYTADVDGGTIRVAPIIGIKGYEGNPVNLKIPFSYKVKHPTSEVFDYTGGKDRINEGAFKNCNSLKSITFSGNTISEGAFESCDNLETAIFEAKDKEELSKDSGNSDRSTVYSGAFKNCKALKTLIIKSQDGILTYTYNSEKENNKDGGFNLKPCTVSKAFEGCPIETIVLPEKYDSYVKPIYIVGEDKKLICTNSESVDLYQMPNFSGFTNLKKINIPYGARYLIEDFVGCTSLEYISIPETVVGTSKAFKDCVNLKEVKILGDETGIADDMFEGCSNVTVVCNTSSKAAEDCKKYGIKAVDFNGNIISEGNVTQKSTTSLQATKNNDISIILNENKLSFTQSPVIENGTTLVPMRAIFEAMGASVKWDGTTQTVTSIKDDTTISLTLNKETATVNDNSIALAVPAKLINGNTMVPLRFVGESLGAEVNWDGASKTITIKE